MQVGMPRNDHGNVHPMAEQCAKLPDVAGAGDVDDVGTELLEHARTAP